MADATSGPELRLRLERVPQRFGTIVVVGGGCYGTYYLRQLGRAARAGALSWERLVVVDKDEACASTRAPAPDELPSFTLEVSAWDTFFSRFLGQAATESQRHANDAIVPSPLMPHLMAGWLLDRARERWPERDVHAAPLESAPEVPWQRAGSDGTHYVSFAEWMCPINCIEPARCPHTRGPRDWTMPEAARELVARAAPTGDPLLGPVIFHCTHRAFGVGMIDARDVVAADAFVSAAASESPASVLVATVSHCHGAFNVLHVGPRSLNRSHA